MMKSAPRPNCPQCGSADTKCAAVEPIYTSADDQKRTLPIARIMSFECSCGMKFTETVIEPPVQEAINRATGDEGG